MHTCCSDGVLTPAELVAKARDRGLSALSVTDHDTIDALHDADIEGTRLGVEIIPGVELSVTVDGHELHLLGYCFDPAHPALNEHLKSFCTSRTERGREIVARLNRLGIPLEMEDVLALCTNGVVGRPHVAKALVARGLVASYDDAFQRYLKDDGMAFVAKPLFPAEQAIAMLHDAGGVAVLAHPGTRTDGRVIKHLIHTGLDGIETIHPSHSPALTRTYQELARKYGLIETGGSDYHGFRPEEDENLSRYSIPYRRLELIRRAAAA